MSVVSLETLLLFTLGALDLVWLRNVMPLPAWVLIANLLWPAVLVCLLSDLAPSSAWWRAAKTASLITAVAAITVGATLLMVAFRRQAAPHQYVHDNAILIEEGIKQVRAVRNYYAADYRGTPLQDWQGGKFFDSSTNTWFDNPALDHYVTLPFYTLASAAVAAVVQPVIGWYDQRITHLLLFGLMVWILWQLPRRRTLRWPYVLVVVANPLAVDALVMGTSDSFVLTWLLLAMSLFDRGRWTLAAAALGLAASSKQTAWVCIPTLAAWGYIQQRIAGALPSRTFVRWLKQWWPLPVIVGLFAAPYVLWDAVAFWDDVYRYPAGLLPTSYPIYGYGLSVLLQLLGLPSLPRSYFPYSLLQVAVVGPLLMLLVRWQWRDATLARAVGSSAVVLLAFWWLSRFFNENYFGVIVALLATAYVLSPENSKSETQNPNPT